MIEKLENARLFSWLEDARGEMARAEIESMVREFMMDLKGWLREERDYEVVCRGLEHVHIRLQVLDEVIRTTGVTGKKKKWPVGACVPCCGTWRSRSGWFTGDWSIRNGSSGVRMIFHLLSGDRGTLKWKLPRWR